MPRTLKIENIPSNKQRKYNRQGRPYPPRLFLKKFTLRFLEEIPYVASPEIIHSQLSADKDVTLENLIAHDACLPLSETSHFFNNKIPTSYLAFQVQKTCCPQGFVINNNCSLSNWRSIIYVIIHTFGIQRQKAMQRPYQALPKIRPALKLSSIC